MPLIHVAVVVGRGGDTSVGVGICTSALALGTGHFASDIWQWSESVQFGPGCGSQSQARPQGGRAPGTASQRIARLPRTCTCFDRFVNKGHQNFQYFESKEVVIAYTSIACIHTCLTARRNEPAEPTIDTGTRSSKHHQKKHQTTTIYLCYYATMLLCYLLHSNRQHNTTQKQAVKPTHLFRDCQKIIAFSRSGGARPVASAYRE